MLTETRDCFFSADDGDVSGAPADGSIEAITSFGKDPAYVTNIHEDIS
jgi:hypothetical protein